MTSTETALAVFGALLVGGALGARATHLPVADGAVRARRLRARTRRLGVLDFDPQSGFVGGARDRRAGRDPVPRRPRGRGRDAPARVAPAAAQARARDADHRVRSSRSPTHALTDLSLDARRSWSARCCRRPTRCCRRASSRTRACRGMVRHSLNLESGLNDGLALPAGARARRRARRATDDFVWWRFVLQDVDARLRLRARDRVRWRRGAAARRPRDDVDPGAPAGALRARRRVRSPTASTTLPPHGNGFIAVFVCAITLGIRRPDIRGCVRGARRGHRRDRQARRSSSSSARC